MRRLYSLFLALASPLVFGYFALRGVRDRRYLERWGERLGWSAPPKGPFDFLVHAASLGEVNAALPLVNALLAREPAPRVLITSITPTGSHRVRELFDDRVAHVYLPIDLPGAVRRFLSETKPAQLVVVETEIWPNLYAEAELQGTPLVMVNARLSSQSVRGYQRFPRLIGRALSSTDRILAQGSRDVERFIRCGADPSRVERAGNLKFDIQLSPSLLETGDLLRAGWGVQRPVLVAGSTHEDDEKVLFAAFRTLRDQHPGALLVLAPRHPERFQRAAQDAEAAGLSVSRRSVSRLPGSADCLVLDTMGELLSYYAAADVAFVGGTLADIGGHNLLEPAALGKPLLFGPHTAHVKETATRLLESGAARRVLTVRDVTREVDHLFGHPVTRDRMGQAGMALVQRGRGALARTLDVLNELSPAQP